MQTGQQVHLVFSPDCKGTVSAIEPSRVRVTWPQRWAVLDKDKTVKLPRMRVWYDKATAVKVLA